MNLDLFRSACHLLLPFISSEFRCSKLVGWRGASQECLPGQPTESMEHKRFVTSTPLVYKCWNVVCDFCSLAPRLLLTTLCDQSATSLAWEDTLTHSLLSCVHTDCWRALQDTRISSSSFPSMHSNIHKLWHHCLYHKYTSCSETLKNVTWLYSTSCMGAGDSVGLNCEDCFKPNGEVVT